MSGFGGAGQVWQGEAWRDRAWCGTAGTVWLAWSALARQGTAGWARRGLACQDMVRLGTAG